MGTTTVETINDPVYNQILSDTFDIESEQGRILWNFFRYGVDYDPSEEVYTDAGGNLVDLKPAMSSNDARASLIEQGYSVSDDTPKMSVDVWWRTLPENKRDQLGTKDSANAKKEYKKDVGVTKYTDSAGNVVSEEDFNALVNNEMLGSGTAEELGYTPTTRGAYEGYDAEGTVSEAELIQQGVGYQSRALAEREPIRAKYNEQVLEGLDTEKYARQAAGDASQAYDASRQGLSTNLALRGAAPTEANMGDNMERAQVIGGAKTQGRNWAETESFNRLSAALNAPA